MAHSYGRFDQSSDRELNPFNTTTYKNRVAETELARPSLIDSAVGSSSQQDPSSEASRHSRLPGSPGSGPIL